MYKARKKFILYSGISIILFLVILLSAINIYNFTMAAEDADRITQRIADRQGRLDDPSNEGMSPQDGKSAPPEASGTEAPPDDPSQTGQQGVQKKHYDRPIRINNGRVGTMGPDSAEMDSSLRYFTFAIDENDNAVPIDFRMSALTEDEAEEWARSLANSSIGWTNGTYRYRVYYDGTTTYVTVIDQSRELWPCYRILFVSIGGGAVLIAVTLLVLILLGKKMFRPFEEADYKQKQFIARIENEFKMPLTVINADTEMLERTYGTDERTKSINKQVKRMIKLVRELGTLRMFEEADSKTTVVLSDILTSIIENSRSRLEEKGLTLTHDIDPDIKIEINDEAISSVICELLENAGKFAKSKVCFSLKKHKDRIVLLQTNDTDLPDGNCDQIFDRFTILENAGENAGSGLGLSHVKEIIKSNDGRVSARVIKGVMNITIDL